jgi:LPS-assembly lipoprotein
LFVSIISLAACGFHLRSAYRLPSQMAHTFIQADNPHSELTRSLKRDLKASEVDLVTNRDEASAILRLFGESSSRRVISVDSLGRAREYELNYQISFSLSATESDWHVQDQVLKLQRDFLFDPEDVLGKAREEATLITDMQRDIQRLIMLRLQALAK